MWLWSVPSSKVHDPASAHRRLLHDDHVTIGERRQPPPRGGRNRKRRHRVGWRGQIVGEVLVRHDHLVRGTQICQVRQQQGQCVVVGHEGSRWCERARRCERRRRRPPGRHLLQPDQVGRVLRDQFGHGPSPLGDLARLHLGPDRAGGSHRIAAGEQRGQVRPEVHVVGLHLDDDCGRGARARGGIGRGRGRCSPGQHQRDSSDSCRPATQRTHINHHFRWTRVRASLAEAPSMRRYAWSS